MATFMPMSSSIRKNFLYNSVLTASNIVFPLLVFPYVSRVLGVAGVGLCDFIDSIVNYFTLISMMGITIIGTREIAMAKSDRNNLDRVYSSLFLLNAITTAIALAALLVVAFTVPRLSAHPGLMLMGAGKVLFNFLLVNWYFQGLEDFRYVTIRTIIVKSLYVAGVFLFVREAEDYGVYYLLTMLMIAVNAVINQAYSRRSVTLSLKKATPRLFLKPYLTMGLYLALISMYTTFNMAYLGFVSDNVQVGYYSTATRVFNIILAFFTAFTTVALPRLSVYVSEGRMDEYKRLLSKSTGVLIAFSIPVIIVAEFLAPHIIMILAGPGYEGGILPMRIALPLMLVVGYEQVMIVQGLMPLQKDNAVLTGTAIGSVVGLSLNLLLVKSMLAVGSSIVWAVSEMVVLASAVFFMHRYAGIGFRYAALLKYAAIYAPLALLLCFAQRMVESFWLQIPVCLGFAGVYVLVVFLIDRRQR